MSVKKLHRPASMALLAASLNLLLAGPSRAVSDEAVKSVATARALAGQGGTTAPEGGATTALTLTPEQQRQTGLRTERLRSVALRPESRAYGRVVDIQPLLELRARYRTAQSELTIAEAALRVAQKNHERLAHLHRESIVATRELIQAESVLAAERARREAARRQIADVREQALQVWGDVMFRKAIDSDSAGFDGLIDHTQILALIALPANQSLPEGARVIKIAPAGDRQQAEEARLVSPAPKTDETVQGETWFFSANTPKLRTGMRLDAWIPQAGDAIPGVALPLSAIVWHGGKPWVYLKTDEQSFSRRPVSEHRDYGDAWFVGTGFEPQQEIVVTGGQLLLSEELRRQLPQAEDD
jgi:hypothetical protein